jgi:hypothetical protein
MTKENIVLVSIRDEQYRVSWPKQWPARVYLRYGLFSPRTTSSNHATDEREHGLSVYRARLLDGVVVLDDETCESLTGQGRLVFAVTGRETGIGSDGEPVLRGVRMLPYPIHLSARR